MTHQPQRDHMNQKCIILVFTIFCLGYLGITQPVTGVWRGRITMGSGLRQSSAPVEVKLIAKGDSLIGATYYYGSGKSYIRYSLRGYFDLVDGSVKWQDFQMVAMVPKRSKEVRAYEETMKYRADYSCPDGKTLLLDGFCQLPDAPEMKLELKKVGDSFFPDEWDEVIEGYYTGMNRKEVLDSVWLIASVPDPAKAPTTNVGVSVAKNDAGPSTADTVKVRPGDIVTIVPASPSSEAASVSAKAGEIAGSTTGAKPGETAGAATPGTRVGETAASGTTKPGETAGTTTVTRPGETSGATTGAKPGEIAGATTSGTRVGETAVSGTTKPGETAGATTGARPGETAGATTLGTRAGENAASGTTKPGQTAGATTGAKPGETAGTTTSGTGVAETSASGTTRPGETTGATTGTRPGETAGATTSGTKVGVTAASGTTKPGETAGSTTGARPGETAGATTSGTKVGETAASGTTKPGETAGATTGAKPGETAGATTSGTKVGETTASGTTKPGETAGATTGAKPGETAGATTSGTRVGETVASGTTRPGVTQATTAIPKPAPPKPAGTVDITDQIAKANAAQRSKESGQVSATQENPPKKTEAQPIPSATPQKTQPVEPSRQSLQVISAPVMADAFNVRKKVIQTEIPIFGDTLEIRFYDNAEVDGDSISLFLNGVALFQHVRLEVRPYIFKIPLQDLPAVSELTMVAENLGAIPPNTAYMEAIVKGERYSARLESTEVTSGVVRLIRRE